MGTRDTADVIRIIFYVTGALLLMITAYALFLRKYKRGTLEALNNVVFITSRYDKYHSKTQFLIDLPRQSHVELYLLDKNEGLVKSLLNAELEVGQHKIEFDPLVYDNGIYYLSLKTNNASMLRKITIEKNS